MNGRVYDPELGRFLSADPLIQAPYNSQSYNRYSYVFNNPLSHTDPSGYETCTPGQDGRYSPDCVDKMVEAMNDGHIDIDGERYTVNVLNQVAFEDWANNPYSYSLVSHGGSFSEEEVIVIGNSDGTSGRGRDYCSVGGAGYAQKRHAWREQSRCKGSCHGYEEK